jgi:hypothetical protein
MRKQYYFRESPNGLLAWDVDRLVLLSSGLPTRAVPLGELREIDESVFGEEEPPTWRSFAAHMQLVQAADLAYPIIRAADGRVMDGRHRITKALVEGRETINAVQFVLDPAPDFVGRRPDELSYEEGPAT